MSAEAARQAFEKLYGHLFLSGKDAAWNVFLSGWEAREKQPEPAHENLSSEWTPCVKLPVTVYVREQRPNETHVSTREGITPVKPDDLIMRGVQGEEYPIGRKIFEQTYRLGEAEQPAQPLPTNCGTGYCSCIECLKVKP